MYVDELRNNPLTGVGLEKMVTELVEFYDWEILHAALRLNCFGGDSSIKKTLKFLKKAEWARNKVEYFYLYRFKQMPAAVGHQRDLPPRERGFVDGVLPKEPLELTVEKIAEMRADAAENYKTQSDDCGSL